MTLKLTQIYVSGALTNGGNRELYEETGEICEANGFYAYLPHLHTDPEKAKDLKPDVIYCIDTMQISNSSLLIAFVNEPSLGVGGEIQFASANNVPIVLVYKNGTKVSRFALGTPGVIKVIDYESDGDLYTKIDDFLESYRVS